MASKQSPWYQQKILHFTMNEEQLVFKSRFFKANRLMKITFLAMNYDCYVPGPSNVDGPVSKLHDNPCYSIYPHKYIYALRYLYVLHGLINT